MAMGRGAAVKSLALACALSLATALAAGAEEGDATKRLKLAAELWERGYVLHMMGEYGDAIRFYRRSIEVKPTADAHTYLGWSMSMLGRLDEAIAECKRAIELDPDFGNPYNDIGVYLIDLGRPEEAVPWLKKATRAKRYCCYQFPHFNLGRVLLSMGELEEARKSFERALAIDPDYLPARAGLKYIDRRAGERL
jgi:tetratricopeptide (TPR) repeat protein